MRLINGHIMRNVHGDVVLVPLSDEETDFQGMIVLNHSGAFLCKMLQQETDRASLITGLAQEYDIAPEQVETDVDAFLSDLDSCHMLIR